MDIRFQNYILLDAARLKACIHEATALNPLHRSLYKDRFEEPLADLGPFLFAVPEEQDEFKNWYAANGLGNAWGVLVESEVSFDELYNHFRNFLLVKTEEGDELYFRFYDPRVLRAFLPTCDKNQLLEFFGPIHKFITEGDTKETAIEFFLNNGELRQRMVKTDQLFGQTLIPPTDLSAVKQNENLIIIEDEPLD